MRRQPHEKAPAAVEPAREGEIVIRDSNLAPPERAGTADPGYAGTEAERQLVACRLLIARMRGDQS